MLDQVWRYTTDQEKNRGIIGLYVSKTTLLKQVNNKFCNQQQHHHFDVVLWAVVSREPNLDKIQDAIGKRIALSAESLKDKSLQDKALDISNILSRKNFKIEVKCLVHNEAWRLFQEKVGSATLRCHSDIPELVQTSARECWSATSTENNWLSHKPDEWKYAIKVLSTSPEIFQEITESFFQSLPSLRVLNLSGNHYLTELRVGISSLVSLHQLDLSHTHISGLPQELKALVLRMLFCGSNHRPIVEEGNVLSDDAESLMKEIHCLEQLNLITLSLQGSRGVENFLKFPKLQNITQSLSIEHCNSLPLNLLHLANMEHLEKLYIEESNLEDWNVDCAGEVQKMRKLHSILIWNCSNVKDLTWLVFAPNLKCLRIHCDDMEEIISVEKLSEVSEMMGELNLFAKLEDLWLESASNLKRIYRDPLPFPQLKQIDIMRCPKLKKLPLNSSSAKGRKIVIRGERKWWEELQWEDQATQNAFSPCFIAYEY
ncbi:hypothetical protein CUMW_261500 [Citrus unshiu]|uniref:NB-ARC domain-containing protein n=1 Tax=Citrus unshiu TaxID=55188 RepID=A0A2H5QUY2_CITUN|nr:hypothetical protein CUMW_261500 [Citrus unshiu]